jgi:hypothetical protein
MTQQPTYIDESATVAHDDAHDCLRKFQRKCHQDSVADAVITKVLRAFMVSCVPEVKTHDEFKVYKNFADFYTIASPTSIIEAIGMLDEDFGLTEWDDAEKVVLKGLQEMLVDVDVTMAHEECCRILSGERGSKVSRPVDYPEAAKNRAAEVARDATKPLHIQLTVPAGVVIGESVPVACWINVHHCSPQDEQLRELLNGEPSETWGIIRKIAPKPKLQDAMIKGGCSSTL